jgi:hypothetical protein
MWILIILSLNSNAQVGYSTGIEFNGKFACELAADKVMEESHNEAFCVSKDDPEIQGPRLPLVCNGIVCYREMPEE